MGKFTISMVIFHSYVKLPEGRLVWIPQKNGHFDRENGEALIIKSEGGKPPQYSDTNRWLDPISTGNPLKNCE